MERKKETKCSTIAHAFISFIIPIQSNNRMHISNSISEYSQLKGKSSWKAASNKNALHTSGNLCSTLSFWAKCKPLGAVPSPLVSSLVWFELNLQQEMETISPGRWISFFFFYIDCLNQSIKNKKTSQLTRSPFSNNCGHHFVSWSQTHNLPACLMLRLLHFSAVCRISACCCCCCRWADVLIHSSILSFVLRFLFPLLSSY